jgi:hypothetical protein
LLALQKAKKSIINHDPSCANFGLRVTKDEAQPFALDHCVSRLQRRYLIGIY